MSEINRIELTDNELRVLVHVSEHCLTEHDYINGYRLQQSTGGVRAPEATLAIKDLVQKKFIEYREMPAERIPGELSKPQTLPGRDTQPTYRMTSEGFQALRQHLPMFRKKNRPINPSSDNP